MQSRLKSKQTFPVANQYISDKQESDGQIGGVPGIELEEIGSDT
jgi:hypothetical protein